MSTVCKSLEGCCVYTYHIHNILLHYDNDNHKLILPNKQTPIYIFTIPFYLTKYHHSYTHTPNPHPSNFLPNKETTIHTHPPIHTNTSSRRKHPPTTHRRTELGRHFSLPPEGGEPNNIFHVCLFSLAFLYKNHMGLL